MKDQTSSSDVIELTFTMVIQLRQLEQSVRMVREYS